ncbi:MAG: magnesium/cobalt transporter CorA [Bryobacteraceae bacterium]|nr:magnesium/cobalt transporter CorA [Bryobacteraceae bacterium]
MIWHDISDPQDNLLDELAEKYKLHPLHIEDCRHRNQAAKVEFNDGYLFIVLKPVVLDLDAEFNASDLDVFIGPDYVITVQEEACAPLSSLLRRVRSADYKRPAELFYRIIDGVVDLYSPVIDQMAERIDVLEEQALESPQTETIEKLFLVRRTLMELRRVLANSRDLTGHLLRTEHPHLPQDLQPFFRDVYDHIARALDLIEVQRDLVAGATELYLSSVANQTNQVMKVLTVFGTVATPAIIITGMYGMNVENLPFAHHPHSWGIVMSLIAAVSALMLLVFKRMRWL